jgi:hypothetical protein
VLKSLEPRATKSSSARRSKPACASRPSGDLYPLLEQYARELPALFIVSQVELERARRPQGDAAGSVTGGTRRRRRVRALLEVHHRHRRRRRFPDHLRPLRAEAVEEICMADRPAESLRAAAAVFALDRLTKWIVEHARLVGRYPTP